MRAKIKNVEIINFRCSKELHLQAEKLSELTMIPVSVMCRLALSEYIKNHSVDIVLSGSVEQSREVAPRVDKPAPPKAQIKKKEYTEDDRLLDEWVKSLGEDESTKKDAFEDDWA
jgi:hypothetical protein